MCMGVADTAFFVHLVVLVSQLASCCCWTSSGRQQRDLLTDISSAGQDTSSPSYVKEVPKRWARPFLALKDPATAAGANVQRLYEQGSSIAAVGYLLFAAAQPLSTADGSSAALLPYLSPGVLRLYVSNPERCGSELAGQLYDLSLDLYSGDMLKACHFDLYTALGSAFSWLRDHTPLKLQEVPDQPLAPAAWPDLERMPHSQLAAAVEDALIGGPSELGEAASLVYLNCGLAPADFAALVPRISAVLQQLHGDLPLLQDVGKQLYDSHWAVYDSSGGGDGAPEALAAADDSHQVYRRLLPEIERGRRDVAAGQRARRLSRRPPPEWSVGAAAAAVAAAAAEKERLRGPAAAATVRRRVAAAISSGGSGGYVYDMPPGGFVTAPPAAMPRLLVPLVFHVMLYPDRSPGTIAPVQYGMAPTFAERLVRVANLMARPTNIQMFVREVRYNPSVYPYLLLDGRVEWLLCPMGGGYGDACLRNTTFVASAVADFPRSVNVFVVSDSTVVRNLPLGYSWIPGSDVTPGNGYVYMTWDGLSTSGSNSLASYNDGPNTLLHEVFHHLGLRHTFRLPGSVNDSRGCVDADYVIDTPTTFGTTTTSSFAAVAMSYCMELFWGQYSGDWEAAYGRWSSTLGIPDTDMNAWADTCPTNAGYDELGNYMSYNTPVCFAALGHFTAAQAQRAHYVTAELNPVLYAWGQYYAAMASPPPQVSPPPEFVNNTCRITRSGCPCKSAWTLNDTTYSYCDRLYGNGTLICEVLDPATCGACTAAVTVGASCLATCAGTSRICKRPLEPGTTNPPPPPPRPPSPPPTPPPPPPRAVPPECKMAASGCPCRTTWQLGGAFYSYCASLNGSAPLQCQVDPSCPSFNPSRPRQLCAANLTPQQCGGRIRIANNIRMSPPPEPPRGPSPPAPPPQPPEPPAPPLAPAPPLKPPLLPPPPSLPPPSPPSPSSGAVAFVSGSLSLAVARCSEMPPGTLGVQLVPEINEALAAVAGVPSGYVELGLLDCIPTSSTASSAGDSTSGQPADAAATSASDGTGTDVLVAYYSVYFPDGAAVAQKVGNLSLLLRSGAAVRSAVNPALQARWGAVIGSSYIDSVVLQPLALVASAGSYIWWQRPSGHTYGLVTALLPTGDVGLVCTASGFGVPEATAICRQLGFTWGLPAAPPASAMGSYASSPLLDGLTCDSAATAAARTAAVGTSGPLDCPAPGIWAPSGGRCNAGAAAAVSCGGGVTASLDVRLTLASPDYDCRGAASLTGGLLLSELFEALGAAALYPVGMSRLVARRPLTCSVAPYGSSEQQLLAAIDGTAVALLVVPYTVQFLSGAKAADVDAAWNASSSPTAVRDVLGQGFAARWGIVAAAAATGLWVMQQEALCSSSPADLASRACAGSIRPPPGSGGTPTPPVAVPETAVPAAMATVTAGAAEAAATAGGAATHGLERRVPGAPLSYKQAIVIFVGIGATLLVLTALLVLAVAVLRRRSGRRSRVRARAGPSASGQWSAWAKREGGGDVLPADARVAVADAGRGSDNGGWGGSGAAIELLTPGAGAVAAAAAALAEPATAMPAAAAAPPLSPAMPAVTAGMVTAPTDPVAPTPLTQVRLAGRDAVAAAATESPAATAAASLSVQRLPPPPNALPDAAATSLSPQRRQGAVQLMSPRSRTDSREAPGSATPLASPALPPPPSSSLTSPSWQRRRLAPLRTGGASAPPPQAAGARPSSAEGGDAAACRQDEEEGEQAQGNGPPRQMAALLPGAPEDTPSAGPG